MHNIRKLITVNFDRTYLPPSIEIFVCPKFFTQLNHAGENKQVNQRPDNTQTK